MPSDIWKVLFNAVLDDFSHGEAMPLFLAFGFALIESASWLRFFMLGLVAAVVAVLGIYATLYLQKGL
jgi:hypothetical protein